MWTLIVVLVICYCTLAVIQTTNNKVKSALSVKGLKLKLCLTFGEQALRRLSTIIVSN